MAQRKCGARRSIFLMRKYKKPRRMLVHRVGTRNCSRQWLKLETCRHCQGKSSCGGSWKVTILNPADSSPQCYVRQLANNSLVKHYAVLFAIFGCITLAVWHEMFAWNVSTPGHYSGIVVDKTLDHGTPLVLVDWPGIGQQSIVVSVFEYKRATAGRAWIMQYAYLPVLGAMGASLCSERPFHCGAVLFGVCVSCAICEGTFNLACLITDCCA